jgi:predicted MFS family arabinose efflux permease
MTSNDTLGAGTAEAPPPPTKFAVFLLAMAAFASACAFRIGDPLLPRLVSDFGVTTGAASLVVTVFGVAYGIAQFFYGPLGDRIGKVRTITIATILCSFGSIGAAFAPSLDVLVACRALSGATGAGIMPLALAFLGDTVPYERRQATLARFLIGSVSGIAGGQMIGGIFADTLGWRYGFVFLGLIYLSVGLALLVFRVAGKSETASKGRPGFAESLRLLFSVSWARIILLVGFLEGAIVFGILAFVPNYLQHRFGVSSTTAGLTGALVTVGGYVYIATAKWLVPGLGERGLVTASGIVLSGSYLLFMLAPSWQLALVGGLICGFGYYLLHATLQTHSTQMVPKVRGTAVSMFASLLFTGQAVGVWVVARLDATVGMAWAFALAAVLMPALTFSLRWAMTRRGTPA